MIIKQKITQTCLLLIFLVAPPLIYAAPSFDCKKARTDVEQAICKDEWLSHFDKALDIIYKQALQRLNNPEKIKMTQIQWMKTRPNGNFFEWGWSPSDNKGYSDAEKKLINALQNDYDSRMNELLELENRKLAVWFLEAFLKNPDDADPVVVCLSILSLWGETDGFNSLEDLMKNFKFIKLTPNKVLVLLNTSSGAHNETYSLYTIFKEAGKLNVKPYILPSRMGSDCHEGDNETDGSDFNISINFDSSINMKVTAYHGHGGKQTWQLNEHGGKLIKDSILLTIDISSFLKLPSKEYQDLQAVDLSRKNFDTLDAERFEAFCHALTQCRGLQTLILYDNNLSALQENRFVIFCQALMQCTGLKELNLSSNNLDKLNGKSFEAFCQVLVQCRGLKKLNLSASLSALHTERFVQFCQVLPKFSGLDKLDLSFNDLNTLDVELWKALGQVLAQCPSLRNLHLGYNHLGALDTERFSEFCHSFAKCPGLHKLNLNGNKLGALDVKRFAAFGQALAKCPGLQMLDLSANDLDTLDVAGFEALGQALAQCPGLQALKLNRNQLDGLNAVRWKAFGEALAQCRSLRKVSLAFNNLGTLDAEHFSAFCQALSKCGTLTEITVIGIDDFSWEQQEQLRMVLSKNQTGKI